MVIVLLLAAVLRLAALPYLPLGLHYDEAANFILTRQIVDDGYRPLFIRAYTGKEVLFFYAAAPWVWMTGGEPWGLRLGAAMLGLLTVSASFAAVRALLTGVRDRNRIALFAAGWMAFAFPHVLLSRYGFRAISQPLLQALVVATLWHGLRSGRTRWLIPAGLSLGLTAYTYLAARLFPIPLALALGMLLVRAPAAARRRLLRRMVIVLIAALVTFAPLGLFFVRNPETFLTRITQVASPSLADAARGIWLCLRALVWPGAGDAYVRFNAPGLPVMRPAAALLALIGFGVLVLTRRRQVLATAGAWLVAATVFVMLLPSALATGEITPSNLRMAGLYPSIAVLPALGLQWLLTRVPWVRVRRLVSLILLLVGGAWTAAQHNAWATSAELFRAADGEMVLAAAALDDAAMPDTTVYIASEHYKHPTVAALADHYTEATWLTGGATLVLPPQGDAVVLVPGSLIPPAPWPGAITEQWTTDSYDDDDLGATLRVHTLGAGAITDLRRNLFASGTHDDFAHVVVAHDAGLPAPCRVGEPCPILVTWEPRAPYPALQPVVRLMHPETGEWSRAMVFHYPTDQWTPGDLVLDQFVLTPPVGMPPGDGYRIGVGFYDPERETALPLLVDEQFAGLEATFPAAGQGVMILPMAEAPSAAQAAAACPGLPRDRSVDLGDVVVEGWTVAPDGPVLSGSKLSVRLCWRAEVESPAFDTLWFATAGAADAKLYAGPPAGGHGFSQWRAGEIIEDRYTLVLPRELPSGESMLALQVDGAAVELASIDVQPSVRNFSSPVLASEADVVFASPEGAVLRLTGYELSEDAAALSVTLGWQLLEEIPDDYVIFVHVRDAETGELIGQVDEMPRPVDGTPRDSYPTSLWVRDEVVVDRHTLSLGNPAGEITVTIGLYLPQTGAHLTVAGERRLELPASP